MSIWVIHKYYKSLNIVILEEDQSIRSYFGWANFNHIMNLPKGCPLAGLQPYVFTLKTKNIKSLLLLALFKNEQGNRTLKPNNLRRYNMQSSTSLFWIIEILSSNLSKHMVQQKVASTFQNQLGFKLK